MRREVGFTLVEVIVVFAIIGLITGMAGLALSSLKAPRAAAWVRELRAARDSAIRTGLAVSVTASVPDTVNNHAPRTTHLLFLPDGRALGAGVDPLTGAPR